MNGVVVIDASLAVKWLVEEPDSDRAILLANSWTQAGVELTAPFLMPIEVANALYKKTQYQELSIADAGLLLDRLMETGIELRYPESLDTRALELAALLGQRAVYDSYYLALAEILDCDLWTADQRFQQIAISGFPRVRSIGEI